MEIPKDLKVHELSSSHIWIDKEGIVYSKPKTDSPPEQTKEQIVSEMAQLRAIIGDKKVCLIGESAANSRPPKKELRDFIAEEISSITKAMALVTPSPVSRMLANLFFSFKPPAYPVKMFQNDSEAREWIRQYL